MSLYNSRNSTFLHGSNQCTFTENKHIFDAYLYTCKKGSKHYNNNITLICNYI